MSLNVNTDTVLLIDAENAFNSINSKVILHNLKYTCHIIATYIINCHAIPSRLVITSGGEKKLMEAQNIFANSRVNITAEGQRDLVAVIGSTEYRDEYVKDSVKDWDNQLTILSTIAETQSQAAYLAFASGFKSKLNYFLRTPSETSSVHCYL